MESVRIMKKIISNFLLIIFIIGCMTVEISTWLTYENAYVIFYIGIAIVILGIIAMIIQGKLKKVIEFIINYF